MFKLNTTIELILLLLVGSKCAEFNDGGSIIQESFVTCGNFVEPCPEIYLSTEAFNCEKFEQVIRYHRTLSYLLIKCKANQTYLINACFLNQMNTFLSSPQ